MYLLVDAVSGCRNAVRELETKLDLSKGMSVNFEREASRRHICAKQAFEAFDA